MPPLPDPEATVRAATPYSIFEPESILVANLTRQAEKLSSAVA
jgi:hypothetical protein